ncbi:MAG TPA: rhomboid family intramembrane serine protease [Rhizobiales bacterium]|nr:rhomboid family intramembrane serine protease [Hyphomicrobiales bacterium]
MFPLMTTVATRYAPVTTWLLILTSSLVFFVQLSLTGPELEVFLMHYALVPKAFFNPGWAAQHGLEGGRLLPFLSNIFLHSGWMHLILNMWTLYIFGPVVEDRLGSLRYLAFFLICGTGASFAHAFANAGSTLPALGASGAIAGIMGAYMRLFPLSRILVVIPIFIFPFFFEIHAALFVGLWFLVQIIGGLGGLFSDAAATTGGIAWWAHIGGFIVGWLLIDLIRRRPPHYREYQRDEGIYGFLPNGQRKGKGPWS